MHLRRIFTLVATLTLAPAALAAAPGSLLPEPLLDPLQWRPQPRRVLPDLKSAVEAQEKARAKDPLKHLAGDMGEVETDLGHWRTGKPVQDKQAKIVDRLEALIAALEKACSGGGGGGGLNATSPMPDSRVAGGPGGVGDLHAPRAGTRQWGQLPPKERQRILQSTTEGFPPGYEAILQSYYRRLAQEDAAADSPPGAPEDANP